MTRSRRIIEDREGDKNGLRGPERDAPGPSAHPQRIRIRIRPVQDLDKLPKLEVDNMQVEVSESYSVTKMLVYNVRDSDLHPLVAKEMRTCQRYFALAGASRSSTWHAITGNTGTMIYCCKASFALSKGYSLDLGLTTGADKLEFEGGFVVEPKPGCYKGAIVIDRNSLYSSIIATLDIYIDRCSSAVLVEALSEKVGCNMKELADSLEIDRVVENDKFVMMRTNTAWMCIRKGGSMFLTIIIENFIKLRSDTKARGDSDIVFCFKTLLTSVLGMLGSRHAIISSKLCTAIIMYLARYYLRTMIRASTDCGYETIYGDTDSIFVETGYDSKTLCSAAGMRIKQAVQAMTKNTPFLSVGAEIKGNYWSIVISAKKKYGTVTWDGELETRG
ncbi:hypothetical protein B7494_g6071 [Chlorociboria aeruginascens]|nr:hypothetical protein B7494_g6071 [Chlorociboria aeruginascens]